ncbi:helix-turn-helix transcriptional regulator [soil metagenome]
MSIRHSLLALLSGGPKYGQLLKAEFEACTGELWPLNVGQVYTTLDRLERDGLAMSSTAPNAALRPYEISPAGTKELRRWLRAVPDEEPPPRDELVMKVMVAAALDPTSSVGVVQSHRRQLLEAMQRFTRLKAMRDVTAATLMMCDAELFRLEAAVRWLDSVDARLKAGELTAMASLSGSTTAAAVAQEVEA